MNRYTLTSPSIDGLLSDDNLYFEGIKRPLIAFALHDAVGAERVLDQDQISKQLDTLSQYFTDISQLFLKKFAAFSTNVFSTDETASKLQALLQEMIKVKKLMESMSGKKER